MALELIWDTSKWLYMVLMEILASIKFTSMRHTCNMYYYVLYIKQIIIFTELTFSNHSFVWGHSEGRGKKRQKQLWLICFRGMLSPGNTYELLIDVEKDVDELTYVKFIWNNSILNPLLPKFGATQIAVQRGWDRKMWVIFYRPLIMDNTGQEFSVSAKTNSNRVPVGHGVWLKMSQGAQAQQKYQHNNTQ